MSLFQTVLPIEEHRAILHHLTPTPPARTLPWGGHPATSCPCTLTSNMYAICELRVGRRGSALGGGPPRGQMKSQAPTHLPQFKEAAILVAHHLLGKLQLCNHT